MVFNGNFEVFKLKRSGDFYELKNFESNNNEMETKKSNKEIKQNTSKKTHEIKTKKKCEKKYINKKKNINIFTKYEYMNKCSHRKYNKYNKNVKKNSKKKQKQSKKNVFYLKKKIFDDIVDKKDKKNVTLKKNKDKINQKQ